MIFSAVSLSLGVALLANLITEILGATFTLAVIGLLLISVSLYFITRLINPKVNQVLRVRGGFFFDPVDLKGKSVIGYEFNVSA